MRSVSEDQLWIDMHSHLFNADDLPVRGFVRHAYLRKLGPFGHVPGAALAVIARLFAPTSRRDRRELERLIETPPPPPTGLRARKVSPGAVVRMVGMGREALFSRLTLAKRIDNLCQDPKAEIDRPIDLYVALGVDLEFGARTRAHSSPARQFDVLELLSAASLLGVLPGTDATILPMVGYDPRRPKGDERNSFEAVVERVMSGHAIGIKLYPAMGFKPIGNAADGTQLGREIDGRLRRLYEWCQREDVPITAHCSPANAVKNADEFAHPEKWSAVLEEYSSLRLNLAHVGGIPKDQWLDDAALLVAEHLTKGHVYADVGNHDLVRQHEQFFARLHALQDNEPTAGFIDRLMFGTDYWFVHMHPRAKSFFHAYSERMLCEFGSDTHKQFSGRAALSLLGFGNPNNRNHQRVVKRMRRLARRRLEVHPQWTPPESYERIFGRLTME